MERAQKGCDLPERIKQLYDIREEHAPDIDENTIREAKRMVKKIIPPPNTYYAFAVLTALNLLNAAVKQPLGKQLTNYQFIKGNAARLFIHLSRLKLPRVQLYYSKSDSVAYFRVLGVQISFHYLPINSKLREAIFREQRSPQTWNGMQLQRIAIGVFNIGKEVLAEHDMTPTPVPARRGKRPRIRTTRKYIRVCCHHELCIHEDKKLSLHEALHFNIWRANRFELLRRKDLRPFRAIRYNGLNHPDVLDYLIGRHPKIERRSEDTMEAGKLYRLSPQKRVRTISPSAHIRTLTQNSYLRREALHCNLLITYNIARYLSEQFPSLHFANTLGYNRLCTKRRLYTPKQLVCVPKGSESRRLKVWLVVDKEGALRDFDMESLPEELIEEYLGAEDFFQEFEILEENGLKGLLAYRRYVLLPCRYERIRVLNYHAYVMNSEQRWAIYALNQERFITDFIYKRIWYDCRKYKIRAEKDDEIIDIFNFFPTNGERKKHKSLSASQENATFVGMKREDFKFEVCANSVESCLAAQEGGADRVELCAGIPEGGTTPSYGEIRQARSVLTKTKLHVIIRPRGGGFAYSEQEIERMLMDIDIARELGADGVVFGCLTPKGGIDKAVCRRLVERAQWMSKTFHRAFDRVSNPRQALETVVKLGFHRILTSGGQPTAEEGLVMLQKLKKRANGRIDIIAASGVNETNIARIRQETGVSEFHFSAREPVPEAADEMFGGVMRTSPQRVRDTIAQAVLDAHIVRQESSLGT